MPQMTQEQLYDRLFHGEAGATTTDDKLPDRDVTSAMLAEADDLTEQLGVTEVPVAQRAPLAALSSPEDYDLDQDYVSLLRDFAPIAQNTFAPEVFTGLGQTSVVLGSVIAGASDLELAVAKIADIIGKLLRGDTDRIEAMMKPGAALPAGVDATLLQIVFGRVPQARAQHQQAEENRKARKKLARQKRQAAVQEAQNKIGDQQVVDTTRRASKSGAALPAAASTPKRTRKSKTSG